MSGIESGQRRQDAGQAPLDTTRVNGKGLWNSWTRNFKTPLLALLDLFDNSVDAGLDGGGMASVRFPGQIHITPDVFYPSIATSVPQYYMEGKTTGICIMNNAIRPIRRLGEILEVYRSYKGKDACSIGENGVGLKQGCATLSDLSIVLSRNRTEFSFGVIAARLQRDEGCVLPAFAINVANGHYHDPPLFLETLRLEIERIFSSQYSELGECVKVYGDGDLRVAINRIVGHIETMTYSPPWNNHDYVFCVLLDRLKHGGQRTDQERREAAAKGTATHQPASAVDSGLLTAEDNERALFESVIKAEAGSALSPASVCDDAFRKVHGLMFELRRELPHHYIHIPPSFEVRVNGEPVQFYYWQQRLVELSTFWVKIDAKNYHLDADDWANPVNNYVIRIFCGFDPNKRTPAAASLLIYSRQSGRLVKHENDARALLHLTGGGTAYAQGLTIIVDDMHGNLPLNPTKQDVAFGEQANGEAHMKNLYDWIGAIAHFYWTRQLEKFSGSKRTLNEQIRKHAIVIDDLARLKPLDQCHFTEYRNVFYKHTSNRAIRVVGKDKLAVDEVPGRDTLMHIKACEVAPTPFRNGKTKALASPLPDHCLSNGLESEARKKLLLRDVGRSAGRSEATADSETPDDILNHIGAFDHSQHISPTRNQPPIRPGADLSDSSSTAGMSLLSKKKRKISSRFLLAADDESDDDNDLSSAVSHAMMSYAPGRMGIAAEARRNGNQDVSARKEVELEQKLVALQAELDSERSARDKAEQKIFELSQHANGFGCNTGELEGVITQLEESSKSQKLELEDYEKKLKFQQDVLDELTQNIIELERNSTVPDVATSNGQQTNLERELAKEVIRLKKMLSVADKKFANELELERSLKRRLKSENDDLKEVLKREQLKQRSDLISNGDELPVVLHTQQNNDILSHVSGTNVEQEERIPSSTVKHKPEDAGAAAFHSGMHGLTANDIFDEDSHGDHFEGDIVRFAI